MAAKKTISRQEVIDVLGSALYQMRNRQAKAEDLKRDVRGTRVRAIAQDDILHALALSNTVENLAAEAEAYGMAAANLEVAARHLDIEADVMEKAAS